MNNNDWLDIDILEDYLDGKLDAKAMHRVERLSLEDPFVAEALAGLSLSPKRVQSMSLLQKQLQDRVAQKPVQEKRWQLTSHRLSIAAAAAVLCVTVSTLFWMRETNNRKQVAANASKEVATAIAPMESQKNEMDKVVEESNEPSYANHSKRPNRNTIKSSTPVVAAAPEMVNTEVELAALDNKAIVGQLEAFDGSEVKAKKILQVDGSSIKGTVYGADKLPILGASVKLKGSASSVMTDRRGEFDLVVDSLLKNPRLNVTSIGFLSKEVVVKKETGLAIELQPDHSTLNEVVITGAGTQSRREGFVAKASPQPVGGMVKFEEYVTQNNKLLVDKKLTGRFVTVYFELDKSGSPVNLKTPKNYNMVPGQTPAEEKEAMRLVKEGPKWVLPTHSNFSSSQTSVIIKF
ncbi:MAG: carboxypeptidase-like regulatory domain-containing protein [Bacteroidia bacterium]